MSIYSLLPLSAGETVRYLEITIENLCCHSLESSESAIVIPKALTSGPFANIPRHTDPFAEADEDTGETKQSQNYIHIRIQREFTSPLPSLREHGVTPSAPHLAISMLT